MAVILDQSIHTFIHRRIPFLLMVFSVLSLWLNMYLVNGVFQASPDKWISALLLAGNIVLLFWPIRRWNRLSVYLYALSQSFLCALIVLLTGKVPADAWLLFIPCALAVAWFGELGAGLLPPLAAVAVFLGATPSFGPESTSIADALFRSVLILVVSLVLTFPVRGNSMERLERRSLEQDLARLRSRFSSVMRTTTESVFLLDSDMRVLEINRAAEGFFGYTADEAKGLPIDRLLSSQYLDLSEHLRSLEISAPSAAPEQLEIQCVRQDGAGFPAEASITRTTENGATYYALFLQDITERKQAEEAFQQANEKLTNWVNELEIRNRESLLLNELGDILQACLNPEEAYTAISQTVQHLFTSGFGILGILNTPRTMVEIKAQWGVATLTPEEQVFAPDECWALRRGRPHQISPTDVNLPCHHVHSPAPLGYLCVPLLAQGEALGLLHVRDLPADREAQDRVQQLAVTLAEHVSLSLSNLRLRETLRNQSMRDPLTGLFNRRYMEESFERELARASRSKHPLGVIMMDIDHFKRFNDTYGHAAGDTLLKELGTFLQRKIRSSDIACRYGGEEFTLILPEASLEDTRKKAEQIRKEISEFHFQNPALSDATISVSLGVASFPKHGASSEELLKSADNALYQAKHEGRNRVVVASGK